ncbi:VOC family protein, partial [Enterococcus faecium]|uniref:VOC family protein n=1 Tax=Enterococcus faecium TaxID=1352 RepID=UPI0039083B5F
LALAPATVFGPFLVVALDNDVSLDYHERDGEIASQHYAFLISDADFDGLLARIKERDIAHWADPGRSKPSAINHDDGGRGVYFDDPDGHL